MNGLPILLVLTALVLGYASLLLFIRLTSQGMAPRRVYGVIAELWGVFVLIIMSLALASMLIPPRPANSVAEELLYTLRHITGLPLLYKVAIIGLFALAIILFVHLLISLRSVTRQLPVSRPPSDGEPLQ